MLRQRLEYMVIQNVSASAPKTPTGKCNFMKLLFNTESLTPPLTGIGNYTFNLIEQLQNRNIEQIDCFIGAKVYSSHEALDNCKVLGNRYTRKNNEKKSGSPPINMRSIVRGWALAYRARELLRNAQLRLRAKEFRHHIYHEPNFMLKPHLGPCVATIHDLSFIQYPQFHPKERVAWLSSQLPKTLKRADFLITDSNIIRDELISDFKVNPDRVRTVYLGASKTYKPQNSEQTISVLDHYGLKHGKYILFVGTLEPRKGVETLINAWCNLPLALREEFPLVLAGAPGWHNQELIDRINFLQATQTLRRLSFVSSSDLPSLYAGAAVFIYPSVYEGFGLPVLEAIQSGVATICTKDTSMAEFTNGNVILVERNNDEELNAELGELLTNGQKRQELAMAGLQRSREFSWERCADETIDIYKAIN